MKRQLSAGPDAIHVAAVDLDEGVLGLVGRQRRGCGALEGWSTLVLDGCAAGLLTHRAPRVAKHARGGSGEPPRPYPRLTCSEFTREMI